MKTKMNISNLKKGLVTICSALLLTTGSYTQPNPRVTMNDEIASMIRLEALMNGTNQSIRFVAPAVVEDEAIAAQERLNTLADATEISVRYKAPASDDVNSTASELERLDRFAAQIERALVFKAPAVTDAPEFKSSQSNGTEIMLADKTK